MHFFSFPTAQSKEAVLCRLEYCRVDTDCGGLLSAIHTAERAGFYLHRKGDWFVGFYENGSRVRRHRRRGTKARPWVIARVSENDTGARFGGILFYSPLVMGVLVSLLLSVGSAWRYGSAQGIAESLVMLTFVAPLGYVMVRDTAQAYRALEQMFKE